MLSKCANPQCMEEFYSLRHGRLFVLDSQPVRSAEHVASCLARQRELLEYFWLCDQCCKSMRVSVDHEHRVLVTSINDPSAKALEVLPSAHPQLLARGRQGQEQILNP